MCRGSAESGLCLEASRDPRRVAKPSSLSVWMGRKNTTDFRGSASLRLSPEQGVAHSGPSRPLGKAGHPWEGKGHLGREPLPIARGRVGAPGCGRSVERALRQVRPRQPRAAGPLPPQPAARAQGRRVLAGRDFIVGPRDRRPPGPLRRPHPRPARRRSSPRSSPSACRCRASWGCRTRASPK